MSAQNIINSLSADGKSLTVSVSGTVGIEGAAELQSALAEAISGVVQVKLDLQKVESIDITALQVICSACKTAAANGCYLFSDLKLPECMIKLNSVIGAHITTHCSQNNGEPCLWFGGGK